VGRLGQPEPARPQFQLHLRQLPTSGKAAKKTPWAGSYWPTYQDSINVRWAGATSQSAAKKYELAFGKTGVEDAVSAQRHRQPHRHPRARATPSAPPTRARVCAKRVGRQRGHLQRDLVRHLPRVGARGDPRGRAEAAGHYNGVEFKVNDLKALMSLAYTADLEVKFMSLRCDDAASAGDLTGKAACKDTNPGSFHVVVANLLGLQGRSFVEDRTYDYEVWNQPVRSYKVTRTPP
jgi:hypothetical protein